RRLDGHAQVDDRRPALRAADGRNLRLVMATVEAVQRSAFLPTLTRVEVWTPALNAAMERFEITTPYRAAAFLAQVAHESGEFSRLVENLNYSAARLCAVWPGRFPTVEAAQPYERNPERLANY